VLVENAELERQLEEELNNGSAAKTAAKSWPDVRVDPATTTRVHDTAAQLPISEDPSSSTGEADVAGGSRLTSVIMMYSPYIPSIDEQQRGDGAAGGSSERSADIGNYYSRIETEESVKCVVSSVLFCAVVIMIVLVAVFKNPGM